MSKKKRKRKGGVSQIIRNQVFERDGYKCYRCGCIVLQGGKRRRKGLPLETIDHYIPRSAGGTNDSDNLKTCCKRCNERKGSKIIGDL